MGAYLQLGHQSHNLIAEPGLSAFAGIVASPVNYHESELRTHIVTARAGRGGDLIDTPKPFDVVFDPQLYVPRSERGHLRDWPYFPSDVDSDDRSDGWWETLVNAVAETANRVQVDAVCSPAIIPRAFTDEYFEQIVST